MIHPELDTIYLQILIEGLTALRDAALAGDLARCQAEAEHLHNIPSLVGEVNENRHLYYIASEKTAYLKWVLEAKRKDLEQFVALNYLPRWQRIEEVLHVDDILSRPQQERNE